MIALMVRPTVIPFRWMGYGVDVRAALIDDARLLFFAQDVCTTLEIPTRWESDPLDPERIVTRYPVPTIAHVDVLGDDGMPAGLLDQVSVHRLADNHPSHLTAEFLAWLDEQVAEFDRPQIERILDARTPPASEVLPVAGGISYTVARAAHILTGDPALQLGQQSLFEAMRLHGWIDRVDGWWRCAKDPVREGWLVIQPRRVPRHKDMYPQIRITRAGVTELHRILGGVATLTLDAPPALTLVDI